MANITDFVTNFFDWSLKTDSFESDVAVGIAVVQLVPNNPRRVALHLSNTGPTPITLSRLNTVLPATGKMMSPGEDFDLYWYNELREIEATWFAISAAAGGSLHLREVMFV